MECLGSVDDVFLAIETDECPMSAGQLSFLECPPPDIAEVRRFVEQRAGTIPRCRQRVRESWCRLTRPVWVDDQDFDIDRHLHRAVLPERSAHALDAFVERVMMLPLDRSRPLWEMWVIDDVAD